VVTQILATEGVNVTTVTATGLGAAWDAVAVAPNNLDVIVIAAQRDLAVTRDHGRTWVRLVNVLPRPAHALVINDANALSLYADLGDLVYSSSDGGLKWRPLPAA
jgi:photosystem II stability/assembly factor-like uncharacterized protein